VHRAFEGYVVVPPVDRVPLLDEREPQPLAVGRYATDGKPVGSW